MRFKHYSPRTEEVYLDWIRHYLRFHGHRHPAALGTADIEAFLTHVAAKRHVTATTQRQALCALILQGRSHSHTHQAKAFVPEGWVKIAHRFNGGGTCRPAPPESPQGSDVLAINRQSHSSETRG